MVDVVLAPSGTGSWSPAVDTWQGMMLKVLSASPSHNSKSDPHQVLLIRANTSPLSLFNTKAHPCLVVLMAMGGKRAEQRKMLVFNEKSKKDKKCKKIPIIRQQSGKPSCWPCCCILVLGYYSEFKDSEIFKVKKKQSIPCRAEKGKEPQRALGRGSG